jgi:hypothetical protein
MICFWCCNIFSVHCSLSAMKPDVMVGINLKNLVHDKWASMRPARFGSAQARSGKAASKRVRHGPNLQWPGRHDLWPGRLLGPSHQGR